MRIKSFILLVTIVWCVFSTAKAQDNDPWVGIWNSSRTELEYWDSYNKNTRKIEPEKFKTRYYLRITKRNGKYSVSEKKVNLEDTTRVSYYQYNVLNATNETIEAYTRDDYSTDQTVEYSTFYYRLWFEGDALVMRRYKLNRYIAEPYRVLTNADYYYTEEESPKQYFYQNNW